jgi:hypothetical protein
MEIVRYLLEQVVLLGGLLFIILYERGNCAYCSMEYLAVAN